MYQEIDIKVMPKLTDGDCEFVSKLKVKKLVVYSSNTNIQFVCLKNKVLKTLEIFLKEKKYEYKYELKRTVYEAKELQQFDFFYSYGQVLPNTTLEYFDYEASRNEGYDMSNYCQRCRQGAIQTGSLKVRGCHINIFKTKNFITPSWTEWFASNELIEKLKQANLTGLDILPVYNTKMSTLSYIHQLKPSNIVKDIFVPEIYHYAEKCPLCENYKNIIYFNEPNKNINNIYIKKECLPLLKDFNESYERRSSYMGYYIISKKFLNVMLDAGIRQGKDVYFWPVQFK